MHRVLLRLFQFTAMVCGLAAACLPAEAQDKRTRKIFSLPTFEDRLIFIGPPGGHRNYSAYAYGGARRGKAEPYDVSIVPHYLCWGRHLGNLRIWIHDVRPGDIIPVLGHLYRVSSMGETTNAGREVAVVKTDRLSREELPPGTTQRPWSLSIPTQRGGKGGATLHDANVTVKEVIPAEKPGGRPTARLTVQGRDDVLTEAVVREGDFVFLNKAVHEVWSIVPPDPKKQFFGWVALNPDPIPEADLVKKKLPFVRPAKP